MYVQPLSICGVLQALHITPRESRKNVQKWVSIAGFRLQLLVFANMNAGLGPFLRALLAELLARTLRV